MRGVSVVAVLFLLCSLALLFAAPAMGWAAPTVEGYKLHHVTLLRSGDALPRYAYQFGIRFASAAERATVTGVSVQPPAGGEPQLLGFSPVCGEPGTEVAVCAGWECPAPPEMPAGGGSYTVTVVGDSGATTFRAGPVTHFPEPVPHIEYPTPGSVIEEMEPLLQWTQYGGFTCEGATPISSQGITVSTPDESIFLWNCNVAPGLHAIAYGFDGSALPLQPGQSYTFQLWENGYEVPLAPLEGGPPGSYVEQTRADAGFTVAGPPAIEQVDITRVRDAYGSGFYLYSQGVSVRVRNPATGGAAALASIVVTTPDWQTITLLPGSPGWSQADALTVLGSWWGTLDSPVSAPYSVTVYDTYGQSDTATSGLPPAFLQPSQTILYPAPSSTIPETAPTFRWSSTEAGSSSVMVFEESNPVALWDGGVGWSLPGISELTYAGPGLQRGYADKWYLWQWRDLAPDPSGDARVSFHDGEGVIGLFAVYDPVLAWTRGPRLPGRLAYTACCGIGISQYSRNPNVHTWLGPVLAEAIAWSPDGTKLLCGGTFGTWIDTLDGAAPSRLPGVVGSTDGDWSPDGTRLVLASHSPEGYPDLQVMGADGSGGQIILTGGGEHRYPRWSPDGRWIAYRFGPAGPETVGMWLVRPDGSENHPVVAAGIAGYPGYDDIYLDAGGWSPDGSRLAVGFAAGDAEGNAVQGIGVIAASGGVLTPLFTALMDYACCASPGLPTWASDGSGIIFASGHHLAPDPEWVNGKLETGVELWEVKADGSSAPVRLTYNHSRDLLPVWWTPNTKPGLAVLVGVGGATATFSLVTAAGHTAIFVPAVPPHRLAMRGSAIPTRSRQRRRFGAELRSPSTTTVPWCRGARTEDWFCYTGLAASGSM